MAERMMEDVSEPSREAKLVTAIVIGAGNRGQTYAGYALEFPDKLKIVGVADPRKFIRTHMQKIFDIPTDNVFEDWRELVEQNKFANAAIIATPDRHHIEPALACAAKGYHILLEKPMAITEEDCRKIVKSCKENNVMLAVCHVLRHFPPMKKIKELIMSGVIGDVVNIQHLEPVGFYHFAHSFVRGNWHKESESTFSLLAKCCHDMDLIHWWMGPNRCQSVSSFGSLQHFRRENKPEGAGSRCVECAVEQQCPYSAQKLYLKNVLMGNIGWPVSIITDVPTPESVKEALEKGPYGKCVYEGENDVCDNQVVNMLFDGGRTATLTMVAFSEKLCERQVRIFGTKGEITYSGGTSIHLFDFLTRLTKEIYPWSITPVRTRLTGHGCADFFLMQNFVEAVAIDDPSLITTGPEDTLESHLLTFAAERARRQNRVVSIEPLMEW
ncbi:putative oxidoreductase YteT [Lytechinus variegatus]|uniref:putative oxidoreductase YteT n=1 Tax=Lytechinus variegatus TaxID=7654 RepID=UPI001BB2092A|nr:putative oxidoreductase YteT [Lytechinus variegatus]